MKQYIVTVINHNHLGMWQTTDSVYCCRSGEEEQFLKKIKKILELNGRDYAIRDVDIPKILMARKD
jgi:hypothetical protein